MKSWGLPLWDLLVGRKRPEVTTPSEVKPPAGKARRARAIVADRVAPVRENAGKPGGTAGRARGERARSKAPAVRECAADRYQRIARELLAEHGVKVRKWRTSMSGVAWELKYHDGSVKRLIESPRPVGPMSMAIFLHEIGHHAIGFNRYKPRCLEEYHAWKFALDQMEARGLNITAGVRLRVHRSLHYAIGKATRRGLASLPAELGPYVEPPLRKARRRARR